MNSHGSRAQLRRPDLQHHLQLPTIADWWHLTRYDPAPLMAHEAITRKPSDAGWPMSEYAIWRINMQPSNALISAMQGVSRGLSRGRRRLVQVPEAMKAARI